MSSRKIKIKIVNVTVWFNSIKALNNVSFHVNTGEFIGVIGPNGAGKTTLLKCIYKAVKPTSGIIYIDGKKINELSYKDIARKISSIPTEIPTEFNLTTADIILMSRYPYIDGLIRWWENKEDISIADNIIRKLGIQDLLNRPFYTLSSGQKKLVLIAKSLIQEPKIILADEPTSNLDLKHQLEICNLLKKISKLGVAIMATFHDLNTASRFCDKLVLLKNGMIYSAGKPDEVLTQKAIREVYDVEAKIIRDGDRLIITPEKPV